MGEVKFSDTLHDEVFFLGELNELAAVQGDAGDSWKTEGEIEWATS